MEAQRVAAFELLAQLLLEAAIGVQPRHFIFVFVGHQLEQAARQRHGQPRRARRRRQFALALRHAIRSEEHTSELQSLMRISYAVFCLKKKKTTNYTHNNHATL